MNKQNKVLKFILLFVLVFCLLTGCKEESQGKHIAPTKYTITENFIATNFIKQVKEGNLVNLRSSSADFTYWTVNDEIVSFDEDYSFTCYRDCTVVEHSDELEKSFVTSCYIKEFDESLKVIASFYNPSDIKVEKCGILISTNKEDINRDIANWQDIIDIDAKEIKDTNEFEIELEDQDSEYVVVSYVITNNGINDKINVCHYSNPYLYNGRGN